MFGLHLVGHGQRKKTLKVKVQTKSAFSNEKWRSAESPVTTGFLQPATGVSTSANGVLQSATGVFEKYEEHQLNHK